MQQLTLSQTDQENPLPSAPPLDLLPPPSSLVPPPGGSSSWQYHPRPLPPPPPDLSAPPPEPVWSDVVSQGCRGGGGGVGRGRFMLLPTSKL